MYPILVITILVMLLIYYFFFFLPAKKKSRREKLKKLPFPKEWEQTLIQYVPIYRYMPKSLKRELHGHIQIFLSEKHFEGCAGLIINDTIRLCIAAQACILLLNRNTDYYPKLRTILVYPHTYVANQIEYQGPIHSEELSVRLGESWQNGTVVLAWDHIKNGACDISSGNNLVLHEFAHQLDQEDGISDGTPYLASKSKYITWSKILTKEFEYLQHAVEHNKKDILDQYGATDPAEFFAVSTETFFEKPIQLKKTHPKLYKELHDYYQVDPATWHH